MSRLGRWLRTLADRLDPHGAPRFIGWSFTFEPGVGIRFRADGRGCRLWHLGNADYERAHSEADTYDVARAAGTSWIGSEHGVDDCGEGCAECDSDPSSLRPPAARLSPPEPIHPRVA